MIFRNTGYQGFMYQLQPSKNHLEEQTIQTRLNGKFNEIRVTQKKLNLQLWLVQISIIFAICITDISRYLYFS